MTDRVQKILKYMWQKKIRKLDLFMALILAAGLFFLGSQAYKADGLFKSSITMTDAYMACQDEKGNTYIIDNGHTRVLKLNLEYEVEFSLRGNSREEDTISYVSDLAVGSSGDIFVEENHWGGMYIDREAILVYDADGNYKATCYDVPYNDEYVDKRKIFGMTAWENWIYFAVLHSDVIEIRRIDQTSYLSEAVAAIDYTNAFNAVYDVSLKPSEKCMYVLDKRGQVLYFDEALQEVLYDCAKDPEYAGKAAFYTMAADSEGNIYLADIKGNSIFRLAKASDGLERLISGGTALSVDVQTQADGTVLVSAVYDGELYQIDGGNNVAFRGSVFERTADFSIFMAIIYAAGAAVLLSGIWVLARGIALLSGLKFSDVTRNGILISGIVVIVVAIIVAQLMASFRSVYTEELFEKLSISAHAVSTQLDAEIIEDVNAPEDFMSDAYNALMDVMEKTLNREYEFNQNIYCNILKYENGEAFSVAYLDQSTGTYYPLDEVETQEVAFVYETGTDVLNGGKDDVAGSFAYVKAPVFGERGHVAAVVAVGSDTTLISQQIRDMQGTVLITLVTIILVLLFLFGEVLGFFDLRSKYKKSAAAAETQGMDGKSEAVPLHMVRLIIFVTFLAFNMATSFLSVYAARLVSDNIGIPRELAASLPVTLNLAFMGIMSLFCAPLMSRFCFKNIAAVSAVICFAGDMTIFLNSNYYALIGGLVLNGIGVGLITNCLNMFISSSRDMDLKRDGFTIFNSGSTSGINIGSMLGASLAGALSQQKVFAVSAAAWIVVAFLFLALGKYISRAGKMAEDEAKRSVGKSMGFGRFIVSPGVWGYMLCVQIPYIMLNSFIFYYVPLYGAEQGFSESVTCLLLMVNSLCSVFFGVGLTNFFVSRFKQATIYISTAMSLGALLLFAASPTVGVLIVTLLIMGISSSFGVSSKSVYFTELPQVRAYGEEQSMGVYNLSDNVGESVGPMIFGPLMASGNLLVSMGQFVSVIFGAGALYCLGSLRKPKRKKGGR